MGLRRRLGRAVALIGWLCGLAVTSHAASLRLCDHSPTLTPLQQDRLLRVAGIARERLDRSDAEVALVSRAGVDLRRFGQRYSHAGVGLRAGRVGAWSVRQLYFACDEARPRLYDQGLPGFVSGTDTPDSGRLSLLLLPAVLARPLAATALDDERALSLLGARYSANAHPWSTRYQNCNQWLVELMALAWGDRAAGGAGEPPRERAQRWLRAAGYTPTRVEVGSHALMFAGGFAPWVRLDDHPEVDRFALALHISLPPALEAFARSRAPGSRHVELCHQGGRLVLREDGPPIADGCVAEAGDRVVLLD
ncbi:DUF2145 domain-containing protein [Aquabacterium sp. J223]|uniref:DUF2145 domain-containing protein n=1 Tax=Aquabacterium sp. J223 TaxID=2898431 RepID=UPI0021AE2146|nr:DUF2145 domain-containing protein [Aquabacterium sp. J223]UUX95926.1 DUF2145 domain-containing protein [Aquabacterium sp. J223]